MPEISLRTRILLLTAVPVVVAALALGGHLLQHRAGDIRDYTRNLHQLTVESYATRLQVLGLDADPDEHHALLRALLEEKDVRAAALHLPDGNNVHAGPRMRPVLDSEPDTPLADPATVQVTDEGWRRAHALEGVPGAALEVEFSDHRQRIELLQTMLTLVLTSLAIVVLALVPAIHFSRRMAAPVQEMAQAVQRIRDGETGVRLNSGASGELGNLERSINSMVAALEEAQQELRQNVDQSTRDLRETLETIEVQNIELDMARKQAMRANRVKSEFLTSMSHEIRTPLNGIIGFTRLLLRSEITPRQHDYLEIIHKSSRTLLALINDILDFARIEAGRLALEETRLELHELIEEVQTMVAFMAREKGLEQAALVYSDVPVHLVGDATRIRQILTNLLNNAIKFTPEGSVVIRAMLEKRDQDTATLRIAVTDTGIGIPEDMQKKLFQAFTQLDNDSDQELAGSGLGLAISRRLAERMGGTMGVDSTPGEGATFWFTLRARIDPDGAEPLETPALEGQSAVVAEPCEPARLALCHMLEAWGMKVQPFPDPNEVPRQPETTPRDTRFVVLGLPRGAEHRERLEKLLEVVERRGQYLVILSHQADKVSAMLPAGDHHRILDKPATRQRLYDTLCELNGESAQRRRAPALPRAFENRHVLVVDDNETNLQLAQQLLEEMGASVRGSASGPEALKAVGEEAFDLILMDIRMPGMDGFETTRRIREFEGTERRTPIIALTAHTMSGQRDKLSEAGLDGLLTKPLSETRLVELMRRQMQPRQRPRMPTPPESGTPAPARDLPVVDPALALQRAGGREYLAGTMHEKLVAHLREDEARLRQLREEGDNGELLECVHRLHGACRYCGTPRLEQAARALEKQLGNGGTAIDREFEQLLAEIRAVRETQPPDWISAKATT